MTTVDAHAIEAALDAPVVITGRGGSGTRLASQVVQSLDVFLGNRLNHTEDSPEWVPALYPLAIATLQGDAAALADATQTLRATATTILAGGTWRPGQRWGWKLPESLLVLPLIAAAFPQARIVHVVRHPLDACLRRSHMTSRTNNPVGAAVLAAAWRRYRLPGAPADGEHPLNNAASWRLQLDDALAFEASAGGARLLRVRYEDLCDDPAGAAARIAAALDVATVPEPALAIDGDRRRRWQADDPAAAAVWALCAPAAEVLGYRFPDAGDERI